MLKPFVSKILITGGSGILGYNYVTQLSDKFYLYYTYNKNYIKIENAIGKKIDFLDKINLKKFLTKTKPNLIIHTIAESSVEKCEADKNLAYNKNIKIVKNLIDCSSTFNTKIIYISTDHLNTFFENSKPNIVNNYANTKLEAEKIILKLCNNSIVIRTNFFGFSKSKKKSFSEKILKNLVKQKKLFLFSDVVFNPIYMDELIDKTIILAKKDLKGIYNISSDQKISKYNFGLKISKIFNLNRNKINKIKISEKNLVKRPKNMTLSNLKFVKDTGIQFNSLDKNIKLMKLSYLFSKVPTINKILPYGTHNIDNNDIKSVVRVLKNGPITQGPEIENFEKNFAKHVGSKFAIAVSSCTAGLHLSTLALNLNKNDEMITSSVSFVSTANAGIYNSLNVFFSDIESDSVNISNKQIQKTVKNFNLKKLKLVVPVHFAGLPCDMKSINKLSMKNKFHLIEDAAHGLGALYKCGNKVGSCKYSLATVFSLHPVKSIAAGEGGIITTNSRSFYEKLLRIRSHGINKGDDEFINKKLSETNGNKNPWYYEMQELGFHYRITDIQCALANSQLNKLNKFILKRNSIYSYYKENLNNLKNIKIIQRNNNFSSHHLFLIKINFNNLGINRQEVMTYLRNKNIITQVHYIPIFLHPYYKRKKNNLSYYPNTLKYYATCLSIPIYYDLSKSHQRYIIKLLKIIDSIV